MYAGPSWPQYVFKFGGTGGTADVLHFFASVSLVILLLCPRMCSFLERSVRVVIVFCLSNTGRLFCNYRAYFFLLNNEREPGNVLQLQEDFGRSLMLLITCARPKRVLYVSHPMGKSTTPLRSRPLAHTPIPPRRTSFLFPLSFFLSFLCSQPIHL